MATTQDIVNYNDYVKAEDIDEEFIDALILLAIKNGAESNPQGG